MMMISTLKIKQFIWFKKKQYKVTDDETLG